MSRAKEAESGAGNRTRSARSRRKAPPPPPPKKSAWRNWRWWALGAVLVFGGLFARLFVVPSVDERASADAVVVFDGDGPGRLERALELMNSQAASVLIIPNGADPAWPAANRICAGGTPFEVLCPASEPGSPRGEAQLVGALATERAWARVAIVTDPLRASRAALLVNRCTDADVVRLAPMEPPGIGSRLAGAPAESLRYLAALAIRRGC